MAERVAEWSPPAPRPTLYPWDAWLDGHIWRLRPNRDFRSSIKDFQTLAHKTAAKRDMQVETRRVKDDHGDALEIQAKELSK